MRARAAAELVAAALASMLALGWAGRVAGEGGHGGAAPTLTEPPPALPPGFAPYREVAPLGPAFDTDDAMPREAALVHHTRLVARLDEARHAIVGTETIAWTNPASVPVRELYLHLYLNAFKNERTAFLRSRLGDGRGSKMPREWGYADVKSVTLVDGDARRDLRDALERHSPGDPEDETDLRLTLPDAVAPGAAIVLELTFESKLPDVVERTGWAGGFHMVAQWFPKLARVRPDGSSSHFTFQRLSEFDADFGEYDVTIDAPAGYVIGATGKRISERATAGRVETRYAARDVHDFAFTAWSGAVESRARIAGVDVHLIAPPRHEGVIARTRAALATGLECYGRRFGRYPYETLTVVHPPPDAEEAGGMEYPTLITTGGPSLSPGAVKLTEALTMHELGHQWFYGLVATDEHREPFLDEGLNSWAEQGCMRELAGDGSALALPGVTVSVEALHRIGALSAGRDDVIARSSADAATAGHYARLVYSRTAALMSSLAGAYGPDVVERAVGRYTRGHRFGHPDARHLLAALDEVGGSELAEAARVGLFERGWIDLAVVDAGTVPRRSPKGVFDREGGRETVTTMDASGDHDVWAVVARRGSLELPVDVELGLADGTRRRVRWEGRGPWVRVTAVSRSPLAWVVVDPDHAIALDERLDDNALALSRGAPPLRLLERLTHAGAAATLLTLP
ncbi:MAG: M1 family metallopeptidase [Polyangiaceae bacterium]|nr:M1 family metallopeptidase [Polyangiaceae bacterium]